MSKERDEDLADNRYEEIGDSNRYEEIGDSNRYEEIKDKGRYEYIPDDEPDDSSQVSY